MSIRQDPEGNEIQALLALAELDDADVLEVGCGAGRLTWRYAERTRHVDAIDPFEPSIDMARQDLPGQLREQVSLQAVDFDAFTAGASPASYDIVLLSWSLC